MLGDGEIGHVDVASIRSKTRATARFGMEPNVATARGISMSLIDQQGRDVYGRIHLGLKSGLDEFAQAAARGAIETTAHRNVPFGEVRPHGIHERFRKLDWVAHFARPDLSAGGD